MDEPIIFGSITKVNNYKRSKGIEITPIDKDGKKASAVQNNGKVFIIGGNDEGKEIEVADKEYALLNNILLRGDPEVVYMQEDVSFYDNYYLGGVKIDDVLLEEVRKIRRIYRDYPQYMYACYVREKYLDRISEKYGMDTILKYTKDDTVIVPRDVFIPPYPIYSKNAKDYDKVRKGEYSYDPVTSSEQPSEEDLLGLMNELAAAVGRDVGRIKCVPGGLETFRPALSAYDDDTISHSSSYSGPSSVNVTDLDMLQKMLRSWHKTEEVKLEQTRERIPFPQSEEGLRQQYLNELGWYIVDHINDDLSEEDENEMVYDSVSKRPMTRKELQRRKTLRMLSEDCGWDMVKLMSQLNVGSKMERKILKNKRNNRKKARKKARSFMADVMGDNFDYGDGVSESELREYLFGDDRRN